MKTFPLEIVTPERVVLTEEVDGVTLPTVDGEITILANHIPLVTVLKAGQLLIHKNSGTEPYAVGGGFAEMNGTTLTILADTAEHVAEIDEQRAEEARQRAQELKNTKQHDTEEYAQIAAKLEKELARLHVVRRFKHRGHTGITHEGLRKE